MTDKAQPIVLNAGSGPPASSSLHPLFRRGGWRELRLDVDHAMKPDVVGSFLELERLVPAASVDAVWSSHSLEHLHTHEVIPALREFRRALREDGFALINCPDLVAVARELLDKGAEGVVYESAMGPIRALDMLYGHAHSIAAGRTAMAHNTGFTAERLGRVAIEAGFSEAWVVEGPGYDLWGALLMPRTDPARLKALFAGTNLESLFEAERSRARG